MTSPAAVPAARPGRARRARSRWLVHIGLMTGLVAALATLQLLHIRQAYHVGVGLVFAALVAYHLIQRRRRIAAMLASLTGHRPAIAREVRLLVSDAVLAFLVLNVTLSGIIDWRRGTPTLVPFLPLPFDRWHALSSVALVVYLIVHVARRWRRLRRSTIR
jgi:hypothetical protein